MTRSLFLRAAFGLILPLVLTAPADAAPRRDLVVFAAASLADALAEVGRSFEAATGVHVSFNFGATSDLARQIRAGAPADVFFSADEAQMDAVEQAGLVRHADRVDLLSNALVVIVPAGKGTPAPPLRAATEIASFARIALADPEAVPAGVYARRWLVSIGLWDALAGRIVPTLNVRGALAAVASGNVPAGIVYRTDAATSDRVSVVFVVPRDSGPAIVYVAAPLRDASEAAPRFLAALSAEEAARTFGTLGFIVLPDHRR